MTDRRKIRRRKEDQQMIALLRRYTLWLVFYGLVFGAVFIIGGYCPGTSIAAANVQMLQPFFHTPGNAQDAYGLPKSYAEQIRWSRLMYNLNGGTASDDYHRYGVRWAEVTASYA